MEPVSRPAQVAAASHTSCAHHALRCDEHQIQAPDEAWAMLPRKTFVVTLTQREAAEDGQIIQLSTLAGNRFAVHVAQGSTVESLVAAVAEECRLGPWINVKVMDADGVLLELSATL
mmetsp:Transcript_83882/g.195144  ORF Transcript_83882/g.195144 Transcript_83882/m.195144 type:complete len:117 (-) Transcript_83882:29-379(-)